MTESDKLKRILAALDCVDIPYVLVGENASVLAEEVNSDVDIVVDQAGLRRMEVFLKKVCTDLNMQLVQILQHETCAFYYVVSWVEQERHLYLRLDICSDYVRNGHRLLGWEELLEGRYRDEASGFYLPSADSNFIYYLLKKIDKGSINTDQFDYLSKLYEAAAGNADAQIDHFWDTTVVSKVKECLLGKDMEYFQESIPEWRGSLRRSMHASPGDRLAEIRRYVGRMLRPAGVWIAILGPDGCGKSSVIDALLPQIEPAFRRTSLLHFRPKVGYHGPADNSNSANPHDQPDRSVVGSLLKLGYYAGDYIIGYFLKVWPARMRSTFLVFDRYYDDLFIDQKRYCYSGPVWALKWVRPFIPQPDLVFCLDAPAEVLQARKQEVPFEVTARQREAYGHLVSSLPNGHVIDASKPLDKVVVDVESTILSFMADRTEKRMSKS